MIVALFVGKLLEWQIDGHFYSTIISAFSEYKMRIDKIQLLGIGTLIQKQFMEPHLVYVVQAWLSFIHHYT